MMWVTMALVAIILGLIMFSSMQDDIPDELSWLKAAPKPAQTVQVETEASSSQTVQGWQVVSKGAITELTKRFSSGFKAGAYEYEPPVMGLMCDGNELHLRVDTQAPVTGRAETPVKLNGKALSWHKAQGTNVLAPDAKAIAKLLMKAREVEFEFSYLDTGLATSRIDTTGLRDASMQLPPACRF